MQAMSKYWNEQVTELTKKRNARIKDIYNYVSNVCTLGLK